MATPLAARRSRKLPGAMVPPPLPLPLPPVLGSFLWVRPILVVVRTLARRFCAFCSELLLRPLSIGGGWNIE